MEFILTNQKCEACNAKAPLATEDQIVSLKLQIPEWDIVESDGVKQLRRSFTFRNFKQALAFTIKVGEMAEVEGHHPLLLTEWGKVEVFWWSHTIGGLHINDFVAAAKTDALFMEKS
ncbi:MAG TPA: 4a-hydroxytetrahydrobiopterin dehydratase [Desulfocapsa sulfexigens]|nr:4a-hydroxytetrahydrobiopterin dehydratase [Desulfocapsa sulfexigens]